MPYYKTLGKDKDMTLNPRIYADDKFIMQAEYRQSLEKSKNAIIFFIQNV